MKLDVDTGTYVRLAQRAMVDFPLQHNKQGKVGLTDCLFWVQGFLQWTNPVFHGLQPIASLLVSIPLSQAYTETMNSVLNKCVGTSRHLLGSEQVGNEMENEMAVRLLGPAAEDSKPIIHRAVHEWSVAAARRLMVSDDFDSTDSDGSSEDGDFALSSSSSSSSDSSLSMTSSSGTSCDDLDTCSEDSMDNTEPCIEPDVPGDEEVDDIVHGNTQADPMDVGPTEVDFFTQLGDTKPRLKKFIGMFLRDWYDELGAFKYITVRELSAAMGMNPGDRAILRDAVDIFLG